MSTSRTSLNPVSVAIHLSIIGSPVMVLLKDHLSVIRDVKKEKLVKIITFSRYTDKSATSQ